MIKTIELLALISMSIFVGGCLIVAMVLVPFWQKMPPADFLGYFSTESIRIGVTMLSLELIAQIFVILAFLENKNDKGARNIWLSSSISFAMTFVLFFIYFLKTNASFMKNTIDHAEVAHELMIWYLVHWLRIGFAVCAILLSYLALKKRVI